MELSFRRITVEQLDEVLARDHERANQKVDEAMPPEIKSWISGYRSCPDAKQNMKDMLSRSDLPVHVCEAALSDDPAGSLVWRYAKSQLDDEGKVAFLDFKKLRVHSRGREFVVGDGIASSLFYNASFENGQGFNL